MTVSLAKPADLTNTAAIAAAALAAYEDGTLQAVKAATGGYAATCKYVGPCAIGVSLDAETRKAWDGRIDGQAIVSIMDAGLAIGDEIALGELQSYHDSFAQSPDYNESWQEDAHMRFLIVAHFYAKGLNK